MHANLEFGEMDWIEEDIALLREAMTDARLEHESNKKSASAKTLRYHRVTQRLKELFGRATRQLRHSFAAITGETTIAAILEELLTLAGKCNIRRIRYYRCEKALGDLQLVLVDSAGHTEEVARRLQVGPIVRFRSGCPLSESDSFWCFALMVPVICVVDPDSSERLEPLYYPGCFPLIPTPIDNCGEDLEGQKSSVWIDIPLVVAGTVVGKLSCDVTIAVDCLTTHTDEFIQLWAAANRQAPYLESIFREQAAFPMAEVMSELQQLTTKEELYRYCTTSLAARFDCPLASIFTRSADALGSAKLVLRDTSFADLRPEIHQACYDLDDDALTAWVGRNNVPLRVHCLNDDRQREQQLDAYKIFDKRLNWRRRVQDSKSQTSYLAVPIPGDLNEVVGVLRFVEKQTSGIGDARFTQRDQTLLMQIAKDAIGPRLLALHRMEAATSYSFRELQEVNSLLVGNVIPSSEEIAQAILGMLKVYFPEDSQGKKLYLVNVLEDDDTFCHFKIGGTLQDDVQEGAVYPLDGSLTGYVLNDSPSRTNAINATAYINDFENAKRRGAMLACCTSAKTALASPIVYRGKAYGAVIVKSDMHDLESERCARMLQLVTAQAGALFARGELELLRELRADFERQAHEQREGTGLSFRTLLTWLREIECNYEGWSDQSRPVSASEKFNVKDTLQSAADAASRDFAPLDCRPRLKVKNVEVRTFRAILATVTYSILKEIFSQRSAGANTVSVSADVNEKEWLKLSIEHVQSSDNDAPSGPAEFSGSSDSTDSVWVDRMEVLWRLLASYSRSRSGRRGRFVANRVANGTGQRFVLTLPMDGPRVR